MKTRTVLALACMGATLADYSRHANAADPPLVKFQVEESTIAGTQAAIKSGTTCKQVVQAYIDRARAYNGVCTALITPDGGKVAAAKGYVRAGKPLVFPTRSVKAAT